MFAAVKQDREVGPPIHVATRNEELVVPTTFPIGVGALFKPRAVRHRSDAARVGAKPVRHIEVAETIKKPPESFGELLLPRSCGMRPIKRRRRPGAFACR